VFNGATAASTGTSIGAIPQQTAQPTVTMIQIGHARRLGKPPQIPGPWGGLLTTSIIKHKEYRPESPKVLADNASQEFSAGWTYVVEFTNVHALSNDALVASTASATGLDGSRILNLRYPLNPQIDGTYQVASTGAVVQFDSEAVYQGIDGRQH
jgi:hypothetical protein